MVSFAKHVRARLGEKARSVGEDAFGIVANRLIQFAKVDPRIRYPSYKSFDEFIDLDRLKALDTYVAERVRAHARRQTDELFYTGLLTRTRKGQKTPGSRVIYLTQSAQPFSYFDLNNAALWKPTENSKEFSELMAFIRTLPFKETARIIIMYDDSGREVTAHRDHVKVKLCHEFIWFRTSLNKPFYLFDPRTTERGYVTSHSAWFDTCNQFHGADPSGGLSVSIRVDGKFDDRFRAQIPVPEYNPASTPSFWACTGSAGSQK